jgi:hypothetical protein
MKEIEVLRETVSRLEGQVKNYETQRNYHNDYLREFYKNKTLEEKNKLLQKECKRLKDKVSLLKERGSKLYNQLHRKKKVEDPNFGKCL